MADRSPNLIDNVTPSGALAYTEQQAPRLAGTPFGPMRKQRDSEPQPVYIPGQRQPSNPPRPTLPKQLTARPLARDLYGPDRWDAISAADAFGTAPGNAA